MTYDGIGDAHRFLDKIKHDGNEMQMTNRYLIECTQHVLGPIPRQWVTNYVIPRIEGMT